VAPDTRTAALIALAHALRCVDKIVDPRQHGLSRRELRARAAAIAEGNWASEAVRMAIEEMMAAIIAGDDRCRRRHHRWVQKLGIA
jgi:Golgi phosphoprotein 3 (GPP34)